jgi:putative phosphoribosyl transferase
MSSFRFSDRSDAGRRLAAALRGYSDGSPIVIALPRGGVPVGYEVARALEAPLDIWVVRKIGLPWQPEVAIGAVAEGGELVLAATMAKASGLSEQELSRAVEEKRGEVAERVRKFRGAHARPALAGRTVILVDDGIATGSTALAAIRAIRRERPAAVVLAVPVAAADCLHALEGEVDRAIALLAPQDLQAVGLWYEDFEQVDDDEVLRLLQLAQSESRGWKAVGRRSSAEQA